MLAPELINSLANKKFKLSGGIGRLRQRRGLIHPAIAGPVSLLRSLNVCARGGALLSSQREIWRS
jgi:hypothetical protein